MPKERFFFVSVFCVGQDIKSKVGSCYINTQGSYINRKDIIEEYKKEDKELSIVEIISVIELNEQDYLDLIKK